MRDRTGQVWEIDDEVKLIVGPPRFEAGPRAFDYVMHPALDLLEGASEAVHVVETTVGELEEYEANAPGLYKRIA